MKKLVYLLIFIFFSTAIYAVRGRYSITAGNQQILITTAPADSSLILIPFEYKQSALYHAFTFEVIDSVVNILLKNDSITLTINGYSHPDEGSDTICKYLALNRALFVRDYILGRGVKESRIIMVRGMSSARSEKSNVNKDGHALNCRAELMLSYPPPPPPVVYDRDEDGVADSVDICADQFGYAANHGCPDTNFILIPFETQQSSLSSVTYQSLDSVILLLKQHPSFTLHIQGHSYRQEGIRQVCERLAMERAVIVKNYLLSRNIPVSRIASVESFGATRPLNSGKNPQDIALNSRAQLIISK